jgi:hypothetical protein
LAKVLIAGLSGALNKLPIPSVAPCHNPAIIPVDPAAFCTGVVPVGLSYPGISPSHIVVIRPVIGIPNRVIIPPVRARIHHAIAYRRSNEILVEGLVNIISVKGIHIPHVVIVIPQTVVVNPHPSKSEQPTIPVGDKHISDAVHPPVIVIVYRYMPDLDYRSEVVVLYIAVVVKARVKGDRCGSKGYSCLYSGRVIEVKVKFAIRIYCEGNPIFYKDEGIGISKSCHGRSQRLFWRSLGASGSQQKDCYKEYNIFHGIRVFSSGCNYLHPPSKNQAPCQTCLNKFKALKYR